MLRPAASRAFSPKSGIISLAFLSALLSCIAVELEGSCLRPNAALGKIGSIKPFSRWHLAEA